MTSEVDLVTGGAGYFGEIVVRKLIAAGRRVRILDLNKPEGYPSSVETVVADIRNRAAVREACSGVACVYHNVAQVPLAKDKHLFWTVNRDGTESLLAAAQAAGARTVVYTSSSAVFGVPDRNPVNEQTKPRPREAYGRAKLEGEHLCTSYAQSGLDVTIIRPRTIVGHGRLGIFQILFEWVRQGQNVPVFGRGDNVYQFVLSDDLADACLLAARRAGPGVFNIGAESFGTMRETLEGLIRHAGSTSKVKSVPMGLFTLLMDVSSVLGLSPLGPYHSLMYGRSLYFDISKAKSELGWQPRYGNVEMICESYDWYLQNRERVLHQSGASAHRSAVRQGALRLLKFVL